MKIRITLLLLLVSVITIAQNPKLEDKTEYRPFSHIDAGFTIGSSGFGFDLASPMGQHFDLRVGFTFIPPVGFNHEYDILRAGRDDEPTPEEEARMDKMCSLLQDLTSTKVDRNIEVEHKLFMYHGKILLDWYPFKNRNFHITAGTFIGSSYVGYATSTPREGATLVGVNMYNSLYNQVIGLDEYEYPSISLGGQSIELDPIAGQEVKDRLSSYGPMRLPMGIFKHDITDSDGNVICHEGEQHYITPNDEGVIRLEMKSHVVKPYAGVGYNAYIGADKRWNLGFDLGIVILGQSPHVYSEDGICLTHDVVGIGGTPGKYIRIVNSFKVYPLLEFKTAYRFH